LKISFHTFGCKLNQVETEAIVELFTAEGHEVTKEGEGDLIFVNTCAVTGRAEAKARRLLRHLANEYPGQVIAAGCLSQLKPDEIASLGDFKLVLGTKERAQVIALLKAKTALKVHISPSLAGEFFFAGGNFFHSRLFLKIQDGCDRRCSYCVVRIVRGNSISLSADIVEQRVRRSLAKFPREIVLTGVDIGSYQDEKGISLAGLLSRLEKIPEVVRIRLSSIEPPGFSEELLEICTAGRKICPHFHLPLQSGSDRILKAMGRTYSAHYYAELIQKLAEKLPQVRIGADIIVGFPKETETDFRQTEQLLDESPITHIHVFPFSPRPGTLFMPKDDIIPPQIKEERAMRLKELIYHRNQEYLKRFLDTEKVVFFEEKDSGFTDNYIRVTVPGENLTGFHTVKLTSLSRNNRQMIGEMV
jgi:threonylcarbamoyladenosine tRNA methylthiotransferase MtaB